MRPSWELWRGHASEDGAIRGKLFALSVDAGGCVRCGQEGDFRDDLSG